MTYCAYKKSKCYCQPIPNGQFCDDHASSSDRKQCLYSMGYLRCDNSRTNGYLFCDAHVAISKRSSKEFNTMVKTACINKRHPSEDLHSYNELYATIDSLPRHVDRMSHREAFNPNGVISVDELQRLFSSTLDDLDDDMNQFYQLMSNNGRLKYVQERLNQQKTRNDRFVIANEKALKTAARIENVLSNAKDTNIRADRTHGCGDVKRGQAPKTFPRTIPFDDENYDNNACTFTETVRCAPSCLMLPYSKNETPEVAIKGVLNFVLDEVTKIPDNFQAYTQERTCNRCRLPGLSHCYNHIYKEPQCLLTKCTYCENVAELNADLCISCLRILMKAERKSMIYSRDGIANVSIGVNDGDLEAVYCMVQKNSSNFSRDNLSENAVGMSKEDLKKASSYDCQRALYSDGLPCDILKSNAVYRASKESSLSLLPIYDKISYSKLFGPEVPEPKVDLAACPYVGSFQFEDLVNGVRTFFIDDLKKFKFDIQLKKGLPSYVIGIENPLVLPRQNNFRIPLAPAPRKVEEMKRFKVDVPMKKPMPAFVMGTENPSIINRPAVRAPILQVQRRPEEMVQFRRPMNTYVVGIDPTQRTTMVRIPVANQGPRRATYVRGQGHPTTVRYLTSVNAKSIVFPRVGPSTQVVYATDGMQNPTQRLKVICPRFTRPISNATGVMASSSHLPLSTSSVPMGVPLKAERIAMRYTTGRLPSPAQIRPANQGAPRPAIISRVITTPGVAGTIPAPRIIVPTALPMNSRMIKVPVKRSAPAQGHLIKVAKNPRLDPEEQKEAECAEILANLSGDQ